MTMQQLNAEIMGACTSSTDADSTTWDFEHTANLTVRVSEAPDLILECGMLAYANRFIKIAVAMRVKEWMFTLEKSIVDGDNDPWLVGGFLDDTHYTFGRLKIQESANVVVDFQQAVVSNFVIKLHPEMYEDLEGDLELNLACRSLISMGAA